MEQIVQSKSLTTTAALNVFAPAVGHTQDYVISAHGS
jgi:hypothetical protein